jgi:hypothetical protein
VCGNAAHGTAEADACVTVLRACRRYVPAEVLATQTREQWLQAVVPHYEAIAHYSATEARCQFVQLLSNLPRGLCALHAATLSAPPADTDARAEHSCGGALARLRACGGGSGALLLGVNRFGLHLFERGSKRHVHSALYREVRHVASGPQVRPEATASPLCSAGAGTMVRLKDGAMAT